MARRAKKVLRLSPDELEMASKRNLKIAKQMRWKRDIYQKPDGVIYPELPSLSEKRRAKIIKKCWPRESKWRTGLRWLKQELFEVLDRNSVTRPICNLLKEKLK